MINLRQAAKQLRRSASWVRKQVAAGRIEVTPQGRQKLVSEAELERFARAEHLDLARDPLVLRLDELRREIAALKQQQAHLDDHVTAMTEQVAALVDVLVKGLTGKTIPPES
jgi:hypothetical protein